MSRALAITLDTMVSSAVAAPDSKKVPAAAAAVVDVGTTSDAPTQSKS